MREKDFNQRWEDDGSRNLIASFFSNPKLEPAKKEHIKQLALEKLAKDKHLTVEKTQKDMTNTKTGWDSRIRVGLRNIWWRWQWKLAIPAVVVIMLFFIGNQFVPHNGFNSYDTSGSASVAPQYMVGSARDSMATSKELASSSSPLVAPTSPEHSESQTKQRQSDGLNSANIKSGIATDLPSPRPPVTNIPPADPTIAKKITHNLNATLQVSNITETINKLNQEFQQMGGYVVDSQQNGRGSGEYGHIRAKIPADKFEGFRTSLPTKGKILSQNQNANDITNQYYDAQTRLQNWEAEQLRYLDILNQAKTVDDILKVEGSLANIRQQIEQLKGQLKLWNNEVDYSTIQLEFQSTITPELKISDPWQPVSWLKTWKATKDAVLKTVSSTWNTLNYGLVGIGYAFPYLILLGIIYLAYRLIMKRKK